MELLPNADAGSRFQRVRLAMRAENAKLPGHDQHSPAQPGDTQQASSSAGEDTAQLDLPVEVLVRAIVDQSLQESDQNTPSDAA